MPVTRTVARAPYQVKTRYQSNLEHKTVTECIAALYRAEGVAGFFRGFKWRLAWGIVLTSSAFGAIEMLNGWWSRRQVRRHPA